MSSIVALRSRISTDEFKFYERKRKRTEIAIFEQYITECRKRVSSLRATRDRDIAAAETTYGQQRQHNEARAIQLQQRLDRLPAKRDSYIQAAEAISFDAETADGLRAKAANVEQKIVSTHEDQQDVQCDLDRIRVLRDSSVKQIEADFSTAYGSVIHDESDEEDC